MAKEVLSHSRMGSGINSRWSWPSQCSPGGPAQRPVWPFRPVGTH